MVRYLSCRSVAYNLTLPCLVKRTLRFVYLGRVEYGVNAIGHSRWVRAAPVPWQERPVRHRLRSSVVFLVALVLAAHFIVSPSCQDRSVRPTTQHLLAALVGVIHDAVQAGLCALFAFCLCLESNENFPFVATARFDEELSLTVVVFDDCALLVSQYVDDNSHAKVERTCRLIDESYCSADRLGRNVQGIRSGLLQACREAWPEWVVDGSG
jgi:hypothetical protein